VILIHRSYIGSLRVVVYPKIFGICTCVRRNYSSWWHFYETYTGMGVFGEGRADDHISVWGPDKFSEAMQQDGNFVSIFVFWELHWGEDVGGDEGSDWFHHYRFSIVIKYWLAIIIKLWGVLFFNFLCYFGDIATIMAPFVWIYIFTYILFECSDFLVSLEVPNWIDFFTTRLIKQHIFFAWWKYYTLNFWLINSQNRFHLWSTNKFNFFTFNKNKICTIWTPSKLSITLESHLMFFSFVICECM